MTLEDRYLKVSRARAEADSDESVLDKISSHAVARLSDQMARNMIPDDQRNGLARVIVSREGRKVGRGTIAAVLGEASSADGALRTATNIAMGLVPMEWDVLCHLYPGKDRLFAKARIIAQRRADCYANS